MNHVLIRHKVGDFTQWRAAYDEHAPVREEAGFKEIHLLRNTENPNEVVLLFEVADLQKARKFASSPDLQEALRQAGVLDHPDIYFLT